MKKLLFALVLLLAAVTLYTNGASANECTEAGCKSESQYGYSHGQGI